MRFIRRLWPSRIALAVAVFPAPELQSLQVLPERVAYQGGAISSRPARGLIGSLQQLLVEDNLHDLHTVYYTPQYIPHPSGSRSSCASLLLLLFRRSRWQISEEDHSVFQDRFSTWIDLLDHKVEVVMGSS